MRTGNCLTKLLNVHNQGKEPRDRARRGISTIKPCSLCGFLKILTLNLANDAANKATLEVVSRNIQIRALALINDVLSVRLETPHRWDYQKV